MNSVPFFKMSGCGNDFVVINDLDSDLALDDLPPFAKKICCRRLSIGADGLIFIAKSKISDFKCYFLNSDGSFADMCGNGARCAARYAYINGISKKQMVFETALGLVAADIIGNLVKIHMPDPKNIKLSYKINFVTSNLILNSVNTGVPHVVIFVENIENIDVVEIGRHVCQQSIFQPERTNVNFAEVLSDGRILVRTYERGVEEETFACGTGGVAAAIVCAIQYSFKSPIIVNNRGGSNLTIFFKKSGIIFTDVFLEGEARVVCTGFLWKEGWKYPQI